MIKSARAMGKKRKGISAVGVAYLPIVGNLSISYPKFSLIFWKDNLMIKSLIKDLSLSLRDKSLLPYQGFIFREVRDLETRKSVDKYIFCIIHNELLICGKMAGKGTQDLDKV